MKVPDIEALLADIGIMAQVPTEMREFTEWLKDRDIKSVLEIGVFKGGTCACWKGLFPDAYVLGIDIGTGSDYLVRDGSLFGLQKRYGFELMLGSNSRLPETFGKVKDKRFDFIFIDGNHSYEAVKSDYEMYRPLVREKGIMVFHDIKDTEFQRMHGCFVGVFWDDLKSGVFGDHSVKEFIDPDEDWGGIGVVFI